MIQPSKLNKSLTLKQLWSRLLSYKLLWYYDSIKYTLRQKNITAKITWMENYILDQMKNFQKDLIKLDKQKNKKQMIEAKKDLVHYFFSSLEPFYEEYFENLQVGNSHNHLGFRSAALEALSPEAIVNQLIVLKEIQEIITKYDESHKISGTPLMADMRDLYFIKILIESAGLSIEERSRAIEWILDYPKKDSIIIRLTNHDLKTIIRKYPLLERTLSKVAYQNNDSELVESILDNPNLTKEIKIVVGLRKSSLA